MSIRKVYRARKRAGLCVRSGCTHKVKTNADGTKRAYCRCCNAVNLKHSAAFRARARQQ